MKRKLSCLVIGLLIIFLSSCYNKYEKDEYSELAICASYAIPGMYCYEIKGNEFDCEVIERDSYGRILYEFRIVNSITEQKETAYIVCQKYGSKYVYFYEDQCYQIAENLNADYESLKLKNDWEQELNYQKMSRRESMMSFDLVIIEDCDLDYFDVLEAGMKKFEVTKEEFDIVSFLDADSNGNGMYLFSVEQGEELEKYIAIVSTEYEINYMEAPDEIVAEVFADFKKENGWEYGW